MGLDVVLYDIDTAIDQIRQEDAVPRAGPEVPAASSQQR
jgi:hypothetical protein